MDAAPAFCSHSQDLTRVDNPHIGYLVSFVFGALVSITIALVLFLFWHLSNKRHSLLETAATTSSYSKEALHTIFSRERGGLPPWLKYPDFCDPVFVNAALQLLWPRIDKAGSEWAFQDRNLENLLNSQTFWKPKWIAATGIVLQSLVLGQIPPRVTNIKVYPLQAGSSQSCLVADMSFSWNSKMEVKLAMKTLDSVQSMSFIDRILSLLYRTISIKVVVRNLVARGQMRVIASPLLDSIPIVGGVHICFLEPPTVSYKVSSLGANPLMLPGLEAWLNSFISEQVMTPFTYPDGVRVNIGDLLGMSVPSGHLHPQGLLAVTVKGATGVPRTDFFGLCDPYVKVYVKKSFANNTSVKSNTLTPIWNEGFEFLVHDVSHQFIHIQLWDSEVFRQDHLIGTAAVQLQSLKLVNGKAHVLVPIREMGKKENGRKLARPLSGVSVESEMDEKLNTDPDNIPSSDMIYMDVLKPTESTGSNFDALVSKAVGGMFKTLSQGRRCFVEVEIEFLRFSSSEALAASEVASNKENVSDYSHLSARAMKFLQGGILFVNLNRAVNLSKSTGTITRKFRIVVSVGDRDKDPTYEKVAERTGIGKGLNAKDPVFDQSIDFLIDGDTARGQDTVLKIEIYVVHVATKPRLRGFVVIDFQDIISNGRLQDRWSLENSASGQLHMSLEWLPAVDTM